MRHTSAFEAARQFYDHITGGRPEQVLETLHPEVHVSESADLPFGGEYDGYQGFTELSERLAALYEPALIDLQIFDAGEVAVARLTGRFTAKATGRSCETEVVELFQVRDGLISQIDIYYQRPAAVAALLDG